MWHKNLLILVLLISLFSCNTEEYSVVEYIAKRDTSFNQLSDKSFFSDIRSICFEDSTYYITDYQRGNVITLNNNLSVNSIYGVKGRGPGEFLGASHIYASQDTIFILNDGKFTVEVFYKNKYLKSLKPSHKQKLLPYMRFVAHANNLYYTNVNDSTNLTKYNWINRSSNRFGELKYYPSTVKTKIMNKRHLFYCKNKIVAVSDCTPVIEFFDLNGVKLKDFNYSDLKNLSELFLYVSREKFEENSYLQLFSDAYVSAEQLFVLSMSVNVIKEEQRLQNNKIIQFDISNDKIKPVRIFDLGKGWFGSICVENNTILAYDHKNVELVKFSYD